MTNENFDFSPGTPVKIGRIGYCHYAIVSDRWHGGKPMLISLSYRVGTVAEEPWDRVAAGRAVRPSELTSMLEPDQVLARARSHLGDRRYHLLKDNCEHFVHDALGLRPRSRQLEMAAGAGATALVLALRLARGHPAIAVASTLIGLLLGSRLSAR